MEEGNDVVVPADVLEEANVASIGLLPPKSRDRYEKQFNAFDEWRKSRQVRGLSEDVLLVYFSGLAKSSKSSSLWTKYSMLKSTLKLYENVDISRFYKLTSFLKGQSRGYQPKKAKTLEREQIEQFLLEAPDDYLMMKVALLIAISGACRCDELVRMNVDDIQDKGSYLLISIKDTKTNKARSFTLIGEGHSVNALDMYRKYASLRPTNASHSRFFLNYRNNKCTVQPVGINTLAKIPRKIADYLKLPEAESYTGHCFRRSSATLLVNSGGDLLTLKRHGGWKSSTVAEGYIEDSVSNKINIAKRIFGNGTSKGNSSTFNMSVETTSSVDKGVHETVNYDQVGGVHFHGNVGAVHFHVDGKEKA